MKVDYSKTIIYKLCCKDTSVKDIYVGATTDMKSRRAVHKSDCNNPNNKGYNKKVYKFIREQGGFSNWDMIMVEKYACKDKLESGKRERYWMEELGATLNKQVPNRTQTEYHKDNKEYRNEYSRQYKKDNKGKIKERKKQYHQENKEKRNEYSRKYHKNNKEKILELRKIKYTCVCGSTISQDHKARHKRTQKHINFINNQT